jgi:hypothetical protein
LVYGLGKKVVVNRKAQLVISRVINLIISEGHVANGKVKGVILKTGALISLDFDVGVGV